MSAAKFHAACCIDRLRERRRRDRLLDVCWPGTEEEPTAPPEASRSEISEASATVRTEFIDLVAAELWDEFTRKNFRGISDWIMAFFAVYPTAWTSRQIARRAVIKPGDDAEKIKIAIDATQSVLPRLVKRGKIGATKIATGWGFTRSLYHPVDYTPTKAEIEQAHKKKEAL